MLKKRFLMIAAILLSVLMLAQAASLLIMATEPNASSNNAGGSADYHDSSLTYTPSADGKTVTISYLLNGDTVSYTVPNDPNYLFGGYAGTDDLGRSLYNANDTGVGAVQAEQERYVGLFYFLWQGTRSTGQDPASWYASGIARDLQKIWETWDGESDLTQLLGRYGEFHWFAEPLYGYYLANDTWVLRKHAELLTNAGVDFLYFDITNKYTYSDNALALMEILHELNTQGYDAPQVVFYANSGASACIQELYEKIYQPEKYPDTWFRIDGKPVIVAPFMEPDATLKEAGVTPDTEANIVRTDMLLGDTDITVAEFFSLKLTNWPISYGVPYTFVENNNSWPWMDFHWPQKVYTDANGENGAISVSIAQASGGRSFSDSVIAGFKFNRGRSFASKGTTTNNVAYSQNDTAYNRQLTYCYNRVQDDPTLSYQGTNFQEQFDYAISTDAKYILVTGWNEWIAANGTNESYPICNFVDTVSIEYSRDAEMTRGYYFDNYYWQIVYNIQRIKGTAPAIVQDGRKPIDVSGSFDQWNDVLVTYTDPSGDTVDREHKAMSATGFIDVTNTSGRNDIVASKVISDSKNLYFYIETVDNITAYDVNSSWMQVYVNADRDAATGWYGYDYIVNYQAASDSATTVAKYTGVDGAYGFTQTGDAVPYRAEGNKMMIAVPLAQVGIDNYLEIDVEFKVADSDTVYDEMEDFYCDGDAAPLGRQNYIYRNYMPAAETETETETETKIETETETETTPETQPISDAETETQPETEPETEADAKEGCSSTIGAGTAVFIAAALFGAAYAGRKRE